MSLSEEYLDFQDRFPGWETVDIDGSECLRKSGDDRHVIKKTAAGTYDHQFRESMLPEGHLSTIMFIENRTLVEALQSAEKDPF